MKPVKRDDGKVYPSVRAAAQELADDGEKATSLEVQIAAAARRYDGRKTAGGYGWEYVPPPVDHEKLRSMLDARGVKYRSNDSKYTFATRWKDRLGRECSFIETVYNGSSKTQFSSEPSSHDVTPEQAIAVTVGTDQGEVYDAGFENGMKYTLQQLEILISRGDMTMLDVEQWIHMQWEVA